MKKYTCILWLLILTGQLAAQCPTSTATPFDAARGGVLTTSGSLINSQPGSTWTQDGGLDNSDGGTWGINGDVYINGDLRLSNNSNIIISSTGRLFVYGNVYINSGSTLTVNTGGNFYFYGDEWVNQPGAVVNNTAGEGAISFIQPRPAPNAVDAVSGSARYPGNATVYTSTSNAAQYVDGGGVDMDVNAALHNPNNISLCNLDNSAGAGSNDTRLSGTLSFVAAEGDVMLNDNSFIFTTTGTYTHNAINPYDAFFVTNGTGELRKEGIANNGLFTFAVGQAENDYTPATVSNTSGSLNNYHVQVKTYAASGSIESVTAEGMDRTWQIYSSSGGVANICLVHNSTTSAAGSGTDGSSFNNTQAFVTRQTSTGFWSSGTQVDGGSPVSSHCSDFTIATSSGASNSYFSKSSDPLTPLPVILTSFDGAVVNCAANLRWKTSSETNSDRFIILQSANGVHFIPVAELVSKNSEQGASYEYRYEDLQSGMNYFRLAMVDKDNHIDYSKVVSVQSNCGASLVIAPNPVQETLTIRGLTSGSEVTVLNAGGQQVTKVQATNSLLRINATTWTKGLYLVKVTDHGRIIKIEKIIKP